jgi:hypothetical protein
VVEPAAGEAVAEVLQRGDFHSCERARPGDGLMGGDW